MLVQLREQPLAPRSDDAVDLLLDCHARIRRFVEMADRLANVAHAPEAQVVDAAGALRRYFEQAFPLHVIDEDLSLLPQLKRLELPKDVAGAVEMLEWEHEELEPLVEGMCLLWKDVEATPSRLREVQPNMTDILDSLRPRLMTHLSLEEEVVLPFARTALSERAMREIREQMRHRRSS